MDERLVRVVLVCGSYGQDSGLATPELLFPKAMFSSSDLSNRKKQNSPLPAGVELADDSALSSRHACWLKGLSSPAGVFKASSMDMPWITDPLIPAESNPISFSCGPVAFRVQRNTFETL